MSLAEAVSFGRSNGQNVTQEAMQKTAGAAPAPLISIVLATVVAATAVAIEHALNTDLAPAVASADVCDS